MIQLPATRIGDRCTQAQRDRIEEASTSLVRLIRTIDPTTNPEQFQTVASEFYCKSMDESDNDTEELTKRYVRLCGNVGMVRAELKGFQERFRSWAAEQGNKGRTKSRPRNPKSAMPNGEQPFLNHRHGYEFKYYATVYAGMATLCILYWFSNNRPS